MANHKEPEEVLFNPRYHRRYAGNDWSEYYIKLALNEVRKSKEPMKLLRRLTMLAFDQGWHVGWSKGVDFGKELAEKYPQKPLGAATAGQRVDTPPAGAATPPRAASSQE